MECAYPAVAAAIATTAAHAESAADAATTTTSTTTAAATTTTTAETTTTAAAATTTAPIRPPSTVSTTEAAAGEAVISDCLAGREQGQPELDSGGSAVAAAAAVAGGAGGDGAAVGDGGTPSLTTAITVTEQGQPELDSGGSGSAAAAVVIAANDTANDSGADPATVVVVVDGNGGGGGGGVNLGTDIAEGGEDDGINNNNNNNSRSCVVDNNNDDETTATDTSCAVGIGVRAHRTTSPPGRTAAACRISSETSTDTISASSVASSTPTAAASSVSDVGVVSSAIGSPLSTSLACVPSESCYSSSTTTCVTFATTSTTATTDTAVAAATISLTKEEEQREDSISGGGSNNNNNNNNEDNDEVVADGEQIEVDIVTERQDVVALVKEHHDLVTRPSNDGHDVFDNDDNDDDNGPTIPKMARLVVMAGPQPPTSSSPPRLASASSPTAPLTSSSSSPPRRSPSVPPPTTTSVEEVEEVHLELATVVDPETATTTATVEGVLVGDGGVGGDADACAADDDNDNVGEPEAEVLLIEAIPSDSSAVVAGELIASLTTPQPDDVHTSMETDVTAEPADMHATTTTAETTTTTTTTEETTTAAITTTIAATTTSTPTTTLTAAPPTAEAVAKTIANETIATTTLVSPTSSSSATIATTTTATMITTPLATVPTEAAFDAVIPITAPPESIIVETSALATATTTTTAAVAPTTITTNTPMTTTSAATAATTTREAEETAAAGTTTIISCPAAAAATTTTTSATKITIPLAVSVPKTAAAAATATLSSTSLPAVPPSVQAAQPAPAEVPMQPAMATTNIIITSTAAPSIVTTAPMPVDQPPAIRRRNADPPVLQQGHQLQYTRTTPNNTNNIITKNIIFTPTMITGCSSSSSTSSSGRGGGGGGGTNTSYSTMTLPGTITTSNRSGFSNNVISTPTIVVQVPHDRNHNNTTRTTTTTTSAAAATTTAATTTAGGMRRTDATDHNDTKVLFDGSEIATEVAPQGGTGGPATGAVAPPVGVSLMDDDWLEEGDGSWPPVWTREMWLERRAKHHWLSAREGRLGCRYCLRVKYMGTTADAIVVSSEWVSYSITYSGDTREQQLKSLRNKLQRHEVSKAHFKAEEIINNFKKNPPVNGEATHMVNKSVQLTTQVFADIYTMVKDSIDFEAYQAAFGASLSDKVYREFALQQEFDVVTIVEHMAEQMKATLVRHVMSQRFPLAVVVDHIEGYLATAESVFLIYLRVQSPSGGLQNVFWDAIPYPWPDDPEMDPMPVVSQSLLDGGFTVEFLSQNLMCFVTDPLGTHLGAGSGSCDQLAQSFDRIVIWYVLAYRLEEMVLSVLRAIEAPNYVGQLYETLYSLMEISERNAQELLINTPAVHEQVSRVGALLHPADVASTFKSVSAIIESYPILYLYMVQAGNDITRTEAEKRKYSFAKGLLESEQFVRELALVYDVLKLLHDTRVQIDHPDCDMPRADSVLVQAMEGLMALQQQPGPFETAALRELQPGASRVFLSVGPLVNNPLLCPPNRVTFMEHIVALSRDNMISISGLEEELVNNFIRDLHTIKLTNWPVNSPVTSADESVERLCSVFQIEDRKPVILNAFRQLIYTGGPPAGEQLSADVVFMQNHANIFPCSSELCAYVVEKINKCKPATSVDGVRRLAASLFVHINGSEQLATLPIVRAWYLKHPLSVELKSPKKARLEDEHWVAYSSIADEIADHQRTDEQGFVAVVHQ